MIGSILFALTGKKKMKKEMNVSMQNLASLVSELRIPTALS
jgi:hypothetical protein